MSIQEASQAAAAFKPKKSVALSGTPAGNTAVCTVGQSGNDLHYRGYDIADLAAHCEFAEVAYLLIHGKLPTAAELAAYKKRLLGLRSLPAEVKHALEQLPASTHPMDVLRTGVSVLGCMRPEADDHNEAGARSIADALLASLPSMLLYWHHYARNGRSIEVDADSESLAEHFLHLLHEKPPSEEWTHAMQVSLILYAEHEFNASTFTARVIAGTGSDLYSCICGAIGALKGPKHGGANEVALEIQQRYHSPMKPRPTFAAASISTKSSSASAIPSTPSAIRAAMSSRSWRANWRGTLKASACSPSPSALKPSCTMPSACSPTSTGSAPWPIT